MGNPQPLEVAMDFIKRINSGNVNWLCELMTEGHIFQDALRQAHDRQREHAPGLDRVLQNGD